MLHSQTKLFSCKWNCPNRAPTTLTHLVIEMRYQYFHGGFRGLQFGSFLATSGSGPVFNAFEHDRARVRLSRILQFAVRVFRRDLQYVLNVLV